MVWFVNHEINSNLSEFLTDPSVVCVHVCMHVCVCVHARTCAYMVHASTMFPNHLNRKYCNLTWNIYV